MEVGIQRTDPTQKIPAQGPRVSFNRDVHVKRIGNRKNESETFSVQTTNLLPPQNSKPTLRREVHSDLSEESILKEAALVLAQAGGVKCFAAGGSEVLGERLNEKTRGRAKQNNSSTPNKFHSLPTRKNKSSKPVTRSVSDVSHKKSKKPSIFSIFTRKSEPNIEEIRSVNSKSIGGKRVSRSKSDVGKRNSHELEQIAESFTKTSQLSPIIENTQREDYFAKQDANARKLAETNQQGNLITETRIEHPEIDKPQFDSSTKAEKRHFTGAQHREFGSLPRTKKKSLNSPQIFQQQSKSLEDMHCSQLPPEKLPLTKGITVDGLVKRLSMERFSPPPQLSSPGFSYIRPSNEQQIVYAQVVCDNDNQTNQFIFSGSEKKALELKNDIRRKSTANYNHRNSTQLADYLGQDLPGLHANKLCLESLHCSYNPHAKIIHSGHSWDGSQRNLSEEDEGLGFETTKYIDDDIVVKSPNLNSHSALNYRSKSQSDEPPIVPIVRKISHNDIRLDLTDRGRADGMDSKRHEKSFESHKEFCDLSSRRAALESKIRNRRFGTIEREMRNNPNQEFIPKKDKDQHRKITAHSYNEDDQSDCFTSAGVDNYHKYHTPNSAEVIHKYSPERTHLDMISPVKEAKSFKYLFRNTKNNELCDIRERSQRKKVLDDLDEPYSKEINRQNILGSQTWPLETGMVVSERSPVQFSTCHEQYEPKSFGFQFSERVRLSPEQDKQGDRCINISNRNKYQQARSFDKGDSGIENDFRKESLTRELVPKRSNLTVEDDIHACKMFLKKERRHVEELHRKRYDFVYRERSIDDGSHFDPRLDKYPKDVSRKSLQKEIDRYSNPSREPGQLGAIKREKKKGSLEKVKKLFSGNSKKKEESADAIATKANKTNGKVSDAYKTRYMVQEEEMRRRYNEYKPHISDTTVTDIAMRRRLSTPKASPLLKRTSSENSQKPSPLSLRDDSTMSKAEKSGWFKSIDRRSKKKQNDRVTLPAQSQGTLTTQDGFSTLQVKKSHRATLESPALVATDKNLRFFGDTDLESVPSFSRAASTPRSRPSAVALKRNQKHSQSAYHLDRIMMPPIHKPQPRSSSLQNLDDGFDEADNSRKQQYCRSPNLDDISESESELSKRHQNHHSSTDRILSSRNMRTIQYDDDLVINERPSLSQRRGSPELARIEYRKPPSGPPKPARTIDNRTTLSRERDRLQDSSGTEGDTSFQSQRSVVYLHATTVGAIPQPYFLNSRRRVLSREELSSLKQKEKVQPMTRTVSRSVSMLAPWKPKHLHDGYEINYSQEPSEKVKKNHLTNKKNTYSNSNKSKKTSIKTGSQQSRSNMSQKADTSPSRPSSSLVSTSKSGISSNKKLPTDYRQNTLSRRNAK